MLGLRAKIAESAAFVRERWPHTPRVGIILGSGLGKFADEIQSPVALPYLEIPNFPKSTAVGHAGRLVCGTIHGVPVVAMQGRFHLYEGYPAQQVTLPVRVMNELGISLLIVSNAAGGVNPLYSSGDLMLIDDHINLMNANPLIGVNDDALGPRFPDMCSPYDKRLIDRALEIARQHNFVAHRGVYVANMGPNYETKAEYRLARQIGGDVVGMSTVPEVIAAVHAGLRVLAISTVTNMCLPDAIKASSGDEVVAIANSAAEKLRAVVLGIIADEAAVSTAS